MFSVEDVWTQWQTQERLGEGAFGTVWRVICSKGGRDAVAAVKLIEIHRDDAEFVALRDMGLGDSDTDGMVEARAMDVLSEIEAMDALKDCPHIVRIEDYRLVELPEGAGYAIAIRMELLTSLPDYVRAAGALSRAEVVRMGIELCRALEACHNKGFIHRDVKPSNVFVGPDGRYKLGDFGIARRLERETAQTMTRKGTGPYMAPEVYFGERYAADIDIYSLGIVLYRYLNGLRFPFLPLAPAPIGSRDMESAERRRLRGEEMPLPAEAGEELGLIVCRACAYDSARRYAGAADLREDLEKWLDSHGTEAEGRVHVGDFDERPDKADPGSSLVEALSGRLSRRRFVGACIGLGLAASVGFVSALRHSLGSRGDDSHKFVDISAGDYHSVAVRADGTVIACGNNGSGQCEVDAWNDIVAVAAGAAHTVGLCADGTVVACGENRFGQCDVFGWKDVTSIAAGHSHTVALCKDGAVVACGNNESGQCEVTSWANVSSLAAGASHTVGLCADGTVAACGGDREGQLDVFGWADVRAVSAGPTHTVALLADGSLVSTGTGYFCGMVGMARLSSVVAVSTGACGTAATLSDGTVVIVGSMRREAEANDLRAWRGAKVIGVGDEHMIGVNPDGIVVAMGSNAYGQCEVGVW